MSIIPSNYQEWKECIEIRCQIRITAAYCRERIEDLQAGKSHQSTQFRKLYGNDYTEKVLEWFQQALKETES